MNVHTSSYVHARSTGRTRSSVRTSSVCPYRDPLDGRTDGPANPPNGTHRASLRPRSATPLVTLRGRTSSVSRSSRPRGS
jgi:hypothetical protein